MMQEPAWWQEWRAGWESIEEYQEALEASIARIDAEQEREARRKKLAAAENAPSLNLSEIDLAWQKRMMFVMYRRPDAVATR